MTTAQITTSQQIASILKGRTLTSLTYGEWDHVLSLTDKHIAECEARKRETGQGGYYIGPETRAKWQRYRDQAKRRAER